MTFSASGSDGLSGIAGPFAWDFGDNTPSKQGANITHTYGDPGTYHVTLTGHDGAGNEGSAEVDVVVKRKRWHRRRRHGHPKPPDKNESAERTAPRSSLGSLKVVAPKKYKLGKNPNPILLTLIASSPGAFQAALTKGSKTVSKGSGVIAKAGTFGFKLTLPKHLTLGTYKLRLTFVPDGTTTGATKTISIKFFRPRAKQPAAGSRRGSSADQSGPSTSGADRRWHRVTGADAGASASGRRSADQRLI